MFTDPHFIEYLLRGYPEHMTQPAPPVRAHNAPPFGRSKNTVAADKRRAKKRKAVKRARRLGHA